MLEFFPNSIYANYDLFIRLKWLRQVLPEKVVKRIPSNGHPEMVENFTESIKSFKASMTFKNLDFDADKSAQYSAVRETMAAIYCNNETLFGPTEAPNWPENFGQLSQEDQVTVKKEIKIQKELTVKGKSRIQEKTKEIRQSFSKAVVSG